MSAVGEQSGPEHDRAETYLRLQVEAELRTALGLPRYKQPRQGHPLASIASRRHRGRRTYRRRSSAQAILRAQSAGAQSAPAPGRSVLQRSVSRFWQPLAPTWHRVVFRFWLSRAHVRARLGRSRQEQATPPAEACLDRVAGLATAFASAGAVTEEAAESLVADMRTALAARGLIDPDDLTGVMQFGHRQRMPQPAPGARQLRAIPVGAVTEYGAAGQGGRVFLGVMVLDGSSAELTVQARFSPGITGPPHSRHHSLHAIFDAFSATDDQGGSYYAHFSGGGSAEEWDGTLHFSPVPPATARWLDVMVPGAEPVRVDLAATPVSYPVTSTSLAADRLAERYVDGVCIDLLQSGDAELADAEAADQIAAVAGLLSSGVLPDRSPALGRFVAVARRLRLDLPDSLAGLRPEALPAEWLAMEATVDRDDAPTGVIAVAAMLPELDGAHCIVTGVRSEPDAATLHVYAHGWPDLHSRTLPFEPFSWTARDDVGGWYVTGHGGGSYNSEGRADMDLPLQPAISPAARSLEIILTGKTGQVSVTVPLDWREGI